MAGITPTAFAKLFNRTMIPSSTSRLSATTPLSVLLVTPPYAGHLLPFATLGEELLKRRHNVTLCTTILSGSNLLSISSIERSGFQFWSAGDDFYMAEDFNKSFRKERSFVESLAWAEETFSEARARLKKTLESYSLQSFDVIVYNPFFHMIPQIAQKWNISVVSIWINLSFNTFVLMPHWQFPVTLLMISHHAKISYWNLETCNKVNHTSHIQLLGTLFQPLLHLLWDWNILPPYPL